MCGSRAQCVFELRPQALRKRERIAYKISEAVSVASGKTQDIIHRCGLASYMNINTPFPCLVWHQGTYYKKKKKRDFLFWRRDVAKSRRSRKIVLQMPQNPEIRG